MKRNGPNLAPGLQASFDRTGSTVSYNRDPVRHPFAVNIVGFQTGKVSFAIFEGRVFTGGPGTGDIMIDTTKLTATNPPGPTVPHLSNANCGTYYTFDVADPAMYLYVRIKWDAAGGEWKQELTVGSLSDINTERAADAPRMESVGETFVENATHGGFPAFLTATAAHCGLNYTLQLSNQGKKFKATSRWVGTYQYLVAVFSTNETAILSYGNLLRSDIFFDRNVPHTTEYIDTGTTGLAMEVGGPCCCPCGCGCGCGCGCCGGCGTCCPGCGGGGGGCSCGGGCGCSPPAPPPGC